MNFIRKVYSILLRQNGWWLEQFEAKSSRPIFAGFFLFVGYITICSVFDLYPSPLVTAIIGGLSSILVSLAGLLSIKESEFPYYITGLFRGSLKYQKFQAIVWVVFWGGGGIAVIVLTIMEK